MAPPYTVIAVPNANAQLAKLYLKYRRLRYVARADFKIHEALKQNPQGGLPISGTNKWSVVVLPLRATYEIAGDIVRILSYQDASAP